MKKIPGPNIFSLFANIKKIRTDVLNFGLDLIKHYGDAVKFNVGPMKIVALNTVDAHKYVLKDHYLDFPKTAGFEKMAPLVGQGLLLANNEFWRQNRRIVTPAFSNNKIPEYFELVKIASKNMFDTFQDEDHRDFHKDMMKLALSAITISLFQRDYSHNSDKVSDAVHIFMAGMEDQIFQILPWHLLPTKKNRDFKEAINFLNEMAFEIINDKRGKSSQNNSDMISLLIAADEQKQGSGITNNYLRDEIITFFIAGHETTANAITWALYLIAQNPKYIIKIQNEISEFIKDDKYTYEDSQKLKTIHNCINESMRLMPPVWINSREAMKDCEIDGYEVKKGSIVVVSPYFLHRNPKYFDRPNDFIPERFEKELVKNSYLPFGLGPRSCIGEQFARMEMIVILVDIFKNFNIKLDEKHEVIPYPTITLRPKNGIKFYFSRRK